MPYFAPAAAAELQVYSRIHKYNLNETSGATLADSGSASTANLTLTGSATLNAGTVGTPASEPYLTLNGSTGYLTSGDGPASMTNYGFVVAFWCNTPANPGADGPLMAFGDGNGAVNAGFEMTHLNGTATLQLTRYGVGSLGTLTNAMPLNVWRRYAVWYPPAGTSLTPLLFVDGLLVKTFTATTLTAGATGARLAFGSAYSSPSTYSTPRVAYKMSRIHVISSPATEVGIISMIAAADYYQQAIGATP